MFVSRAGLYELNVFLNAYLIFVLFSRYQIERYNALLRIIKSSLIDLEKGIKGLVVMSSDLEETFNCIFDAKVPSLWGKVSFHIFFTMISVNT